MVQASTSPLSNQNYFYGNEITGNSGDGIQLLSSNGTIIGGTEDSQINLISRNTADGIDMYQCANSQIVGNYIGTDADANFIPGQGNTGDGVFINGPLSTNDYVTGNTIRDNENGVTLLMANGNFVQGNIITNNAGNGVNLASGASNDMIGGLSPALGNTISDNSMNGIEVNYGNDDPLLENGIFDNIGLGIDLDPQGVTLNDPQEDLDADTGSNNLQNFPVLTMATIGGTNQIEGYIQTEANTTIVIEFFNLEQPDPSGYGEGDHFIRSWTVTTNSGGVATFSVPLADPVDVGSYISAIAIDADGNTSEFSKAIVVQNDSDGDGIGDDTENAGPNGGDANHDSIPDSQEPECRDIPERSQRTIRHPVRARRNDVQQRVGRHQSVAGRCST